MIQLKNLTPHVYSDQSRDFQFIERLFDVVLNSVKTNCYNLYNLPFNDATDSRLITSLALTLGFKSRHRYNVKQLASLCSAFSEILRYKGTLHSIGLTCKALLNAEGITDEAFIEKSEEDNYSIVVYVPQSLSDVSLLKDVLDYTLPAGITYKLVRELHLNKQATTTLATSDKVVVYDDSNAAWTGGSFSDAKDATTSTVATIADIASLKNSIDGGTNLKGTPGAIGNITVVQPK